LTIWRFLSIIISFYIFLLFLRIILSWFQGSIYGRPWELLIRVTDPYLSLFSRLRFLRQGMFNFTPLAAIVTLLIARTVLAQIDSPAKLTVGIFLGIVVSGIWSAGRFLLLMFLFLAILRVILLAIPSTRDSRIASSLGYMVEPTVNLMRRIFGARRPMDDRQYLYVSVAFLFVVYFLARFIFLGLIRLLVSLPI
jgi:YggT family protein